MQTEGLPRYGCGSYCCVKVVTVNGPDLSRPYVLTRYIGGSVRTEQFIAWKGTDQLQRVRRAAARSVQKYYAHPVISERLICSIFLGV